MAQDKFIGAFLSHFRIEAKLGEGGMGRVYRARDMRLRRPVAVKMLSPALARDKQALDRLQLEAIAASSINHPNICTIYEIDSYRGRPFIVMEYIRGETLRDRLNRRGVLPPIEVIRLFEQIGPALSLAHKAGIVHLDLKPANIMICAETNLAKITDFGLARLASESAVQDMIRSASPAPDSLTDSQRYAMTLTGIMGTAAYMAPEQVMRADIDHRADIFVLGIVLYELLTGINPFRADDQITTLQNIRNVDEKRIASTHLPSHFAAIVSTCLQVAPENRYADVDALLADLQKVKKHVRTPRHESPLSKKAVDALPKAKRAAAIVLLLLMAGALLFGLHQWGLIAGLRQSDRASTTNRDLTTTSATAYRLFKQGQQDYWRYANRDAIEKLQAAVALDSSFSYAQVLLGMLLIWQNRTDEAKACFAVAARHQNGLTDAERLFVKGMLFYAADDKTAMLKTFTTMTDRYPNHIDGLLAASLACERLKDYAKAIKFTQRVIAIDSTHIAAYSNMADMLKWQGRYEEALAYADKQFELIVASGDQRGLESAAEIVGRLNYYLDHPQRAVSYLQQSLDLDPRNRDASECLAETYAMQGRMADATKVLQDAIGKPMKNEALAGLFTRLAHLYAFQGRYVDALAAFNKAATLNPKTFILTMLERSVIFSEMKQPELIRQDINRSLESMSIAQDNATSRFIVLNFYYHLLLGDEQGMMEWHRKFVDLAGRENAKEMTIDLAIFRGGMEQAQDLLAERIACDPAYALGDQTGHCFKLASLYFQKQKFNEAILVCQQGLKTRHILGYVVRAIAFNKMLALLSQIYEATGRYEQSNAACERFMTYWADADPNIPLLLEMKQRQARLKRRRAGSG